MINLFTPTSASFSIMKLKLLFLITGITVVSVLFGEISDFNMPTLSTSHIFLDSLMTLHSADLPLPSKISTKLSFLIRKALIK